ncbi:autotransporter assembly complex family protein [Kingella kingae]|uniref:autotransporter assembly complex protein TamA n=1 Tax=Kingella kingae TaxID=504 RepID=UPI00056FCFFF|nr:autotransporter assembly complex family protein [Kingella kingae]MDK4587012.1 autotransporter assembly complex family protein [Kingella kingae]MDK4605010.1 autotransporter assembly complex family protein [Kingella kingae]MDK4614976.1 autotransporter assembly complex family protein [Kingella kingae]MDK4619235.1 autotransporter assembly complex family protein [Kingella kingae]MDK4630837.1 autotransporter assembly complex family protein [Kingella kingae]
MTNKHTYFPLLGLLLLLNQPAWSNTTDTVQAASASAPAGNPTDTEAEVSNLTPKYPVTIEADNEELKQMLEEFLPLIAYQRKEELDQEQVGYLAEDAPKDAQNMLKTEGYFNAQVTVSPQGAGWLVKVVSGKRTHIENVNVAILGDIVQDADLGTYYKNALQKWQLPVRAPFRQEHWSASKVAVLSAVSRKKYPLATLETSQAEINPQTQTADLTVQINSKKPVYFGDFQIVGNERYPESVIRGLAQFNTGDVYDLDKLLNYQQALESDSHYSGASVQADFEQLQDDRVPVKVAVTEVKRQKVEAGLSFDSEYGLGGNIGYEHYNLFNRGYVGSVALSADKYQTALGLGISQPRNSKGHYWTTNMTYSRNTTQKLETRSLSSGIWHVRDRDGIEARYGLEFIGQDSKIPDSGINFGRSFVTMLTASWKRQNIETTMRPANGYYFDGKIGTTLGKLLSSTMAVRIKGNAGYYFTPENKQLGTFVARGELGYVYTKDKLEGGDVPTMLMFRTGGASSVRGYELDSIGLRTDYTDAVLPGRAMFVASGEYQYPIKNDFALAVFHDVGSVAHNFKDMTLRHGTGLGVRWFSPVAPFSFDIAHGHHDRKIRWHISLGTRF